VPKKTCSDPLSIVVLAAQTAEIALFCASRYTLETVASKGECDDLPAGVY